MNRDELKAVMGWMARDQTAAFPAAAVAGACLTLLFLPVVQSPAHEIPDWAPLAPMLIGLAGLVIGGGVGFGDKARTGLSSRLPMSWAAHGLAAASWLGILSLPTLGILGFALWRGPEPSSVIRAIFAFVVGFACAYSVISEKGRNRLLFHSLLWTTFVSVWLISTKAGGNGWILIGRDAVAMITALLLAGAATYLRWSEGTSRDETYVWPVMSLFGMFALFFYFGPAISEYFQILSGLVFAALIVQSVRIVRSRPQGPLPRSISNPGPLARGVVFLLVGMMSCQTIFETDGDTPNLLSKWLRQDVDAVLGADSLQDAVVQATLRAVVYGWIVIMLGSWIWVEILRVRSVTNAKNELQLSSRLPVSRPALARSLVLGCLKPLLPAGVAILTVSVAGLFLMNDRWVLELGIVDLCLLTIFTCSATISAALGRGYVEQVLIALGVTATALTAALIVGSSVYVPILILEAAAALRLCLLSTKPAARRFVLP